MTTPAKKYRWLVLVPATLALSLFSGCTTHLKGIVLDERRTPVSDAQFTIGYPAGVGATQTYPVNNRGEFDFWVSPTDENHLYLWNGKGDPMVSTRKIDRGEINDHMTLVLPRNPAD